MRLVPPWLAPHHFLRIPREGLGRPIYVFTRGIAATELVTETQLNEPARHMTDRALDRLGAAWVASIADTLRAQIAPPRASSSRSMVVRSALSEYLSQLDISKPESNSPSSLFGEPLPPRIPPDVIDRFEREDLPRITQYVQHEIAPLARHLGAAADANEAPDPSMLPGARRYLGLWAPPLDLVPLRRPAHPDIQLWGLSYTNLLQRVAVELFELATLRPRLRRCVFCNAVFAVQDNEANCRWNLWDADTGELLKSCNPERFREWEENAAADAHRKTRKKYDQRIRRALLETGGDYRNATVQLRIKEKTAYMEGHRRRPGPKLRVTPTENDVVSVVKDEAAKAGDQP
jgi:hypothetical protein